MRIAYIILMYKYPQQTIRLVNTLNTSTASFWIHVDRKTSREVYQEMLEGLSNYPNVHFINRHKCYWGDFGHVSASLEGIKSILNSNINCDYISLLTGQCYPIKSNEYIEDFLKSLNVHSLVDYFSLPSEAWLNGGEERGGMNRIEYFYYHLFNKYFKLSLFNYKLKRKFPLGFKPFAGSSYWLLTRELAQHINDFTSQNYSFVKFFKNVLIPDEIFYQTIIMNSEFRDKIISDTMTYTSWQNNSAHPEILNVSHFERLSQSSCLYARKFDTTEDRGILDLIDKLLLSE